MNLDGVCGLWLVTQAPNPQNHFAIVECGRRASTRIQRTRLLRPFESEESARGREPARLADRERGDGAPVVFMAKTQVI